MKTRSVILVMYALLCCSCKKNPTPNPSGCTKTIIEITTSQINTATTWDSCHYYYIKTNVNVNAPLTIEPGTVIKFNNLGGIQVNAGGVIKAIGTTAKPIVFTSDKDDFFGNDITGDGNASVPQGGDWNHITTNGQNNSEFSYCIFQYAGNSTGGGALYVASNSKATIVDHCFFKYNKSSLNFNSANPALDATGGGDGTVITNNLFDQNILPLGVSTGFSLDNSNDFLNNKFACITVSNAFATQRSISWLAAKQPFAITSQLSFISDTLTLGPDVVLKFTDPIFQLTVQNILNLPGADIPGVRFTSFKDDYQFFDSNGDGSATAPAANDWQGIRWNEMNSWYNLPNVFYAAH